MQAREPYIRRHQTADEKQSRPISRNSKATDHVLGIETTHNPATSLHKDDFFFLCNKKECSAINTRSSQEAYQ